MHEEKYFCENIKKYIKNRKCKNYVKRVKNVYRNIC